MNLHGFPKIIHQIWWQGDLPIKYHKWAQTWQDLHPDWTYKLWSETSILAFVQKHYSQFYPQFCGLNKMIKKIDCFKYMVLAYEGGLYVDVDMECLVPLEQCLPYTKKNTLLCYEPFLHRTLNSSPNMCGNAWIFSKKQNSSLKQLVELILTMKRTPEKDLFTDVILHTGPKMLTAFYLNNEDEFCLLPASFVYPLHFFQTFKKDVQQIQINKKGNSVIHACHYWNASWADLPDLSGFVLIVTLAFFFLRYVICYPFFVWQEKKLLKR